jgi:TolB protein
MTPIRLQLLTPVVVACLLALGGVARADYDYIDITNPFLRKIPMAVPVFKPVAGHPAERQAAAQAADQLAGALEFTGYFKILDRGAFLVKPETMGIIAPNINFQDWTAIGAELLVTGGLSLKGQYLEMELRLFDTFKSQLLIGKRYKGLVADQRRMIHRFCGEVIFALTGSHGIFESRIAFVSSGPGNKEIFTADFDGHAPQQLTRNQAITLSPDWSSDGRWMAYTSYRQGKPDLFIRNLAQRRGSVVDRPGLNATPAWRPDKFELAATLSFSGDPEIYLLTGEGKIIKRLTASKGIDISPAWSPDGRKLAFVSNRSGSPQIHVQDVASGREERLTFEGRYNTTPSWSPTGDRIAYSSAEDGGFNIHVIDLGTRKRLQLTRNTGNNESPSWSPDGSLIVFSSNREGPYRIYVMTGYGTDQRRLLTLPGEQTNPKWSRRIVN